MATLQSGGTIHGDASETAILEFLCKHNDPIAVRDIFPKVVEIPFNSVNKYQVSLTAAVRWYLLNIYSQLMLVVRQSIGCSKFSVYL